MAVNRNVTLSLEINEVFTKKSGDFNTVLQEVIDFYLAIKEESVKEEGWGERIKIDKGRSTRLINLLLSNAQEEIDEPDSKFTAPPDFELPFGDPLDVIINGAAQILYNRAIETDRKRPYNYSDSVRLLHIILLELGINYYDPTYNDLLKRYFLRLIEIGALKDSDSSWPSNYPIKAYQNLHNNSNNFDRLEIPGDSDYYGVEEVDQLYKDTDSLIGNSANLIPKIVQEFLDRTASNDLGDYFKYRPDNMPF